MTTTLKTTETMPTLRILYAPKEGNRDDQYEDAVAHTPLDPTAPSLTIALSDGASAAVYAREWANLLVARFADGSSFPATDSEVAAIVAEQGEQWRARTAGKSDAWWAQEKLPSGSAATLLVVTWDQERRTWSARSVGDVCLFVVRNNRLKYAFPLTRSHRFDDRPALLTSETGKPRVSFPPVVRYEAPYEPEDRFLLMTDALSAWFLAEFEARRKPWNDLPVEGEALTRWLKNLRDKGRMKNDDVTLVDLYT